MSDAAVAEDEDAKKPSKLPLIIGLVLALAGGGGGFFAVQSGLLGLGAPASETAAEPAPEVEALPNVTFVSLPTLVISLPAGAGIDFLRFQADLEVPSRYAAEVESILPRVVDVLNSYLRAIEPGDVTQPGALIRLRGQMLRRVQLVTGEGRVSNLLVMEFVLN